MCAAGPKQCRTNTPFNMAWLRRLDKVSNQHVSLSIVIRRTTVSNLPRGMAQLNALEERG